MKEIEMGEMADFERDYGNGREGTGGVHKKLYTIKRALIGKEST